MEIHKLDISLPVRVESGPLQIGEDWPGLFLRGDDCIALWELLRRAKAQMHGTLDQIYLDYYLTLLGAVRV